MKIFEVIDMRTLESDVELKENQDKGDFYETARCKNCKYYRFHNNTCSARNGNRITATTHCSYFEQSAPEQIEQVDLFIKKFGPDMVDDTIVAVKQEKVPSERCADLLKSSQSNVDDMLKVFREILDMNGYWYAVAIETSNSIKDKIAMTGTTPKDVNAIFDEARRFLTVNGIDDRHLVFARNKLVLRCITATLKEIRKELEDDLLI
jgi:hypothetical protein